MEQPPRYLGLDYGDRTIGVAVSDPRNIVATGVETIRRADPLAMKPSLKRLGELINNYGITRIILGNPLHMDGNPSARSEKTALFADKIRRYFKHIPVSLWDERLSTQAVARSLQNTTRVDEMAAVYILQGYLDAANNAPTTKETTMDNVLLIKDDEGNDIPFDILASKEREGTLYILAAEANDEDEAELVHLKCVGNDGEDMVFEFVDEDSDEFDWMFELFKAEYDELGVEIEE
jgi:putative Holliday junction resolvase